jgi:long-chain acyl-CoA synthetase
MAQTAPLAKTIPATAPARELFDGRRWVWEGHYPHGVSWNAPYEKKPLYHLLDRAAEKYGQNIAVDFLGETISYAALARMADRVAEGLQKLGVGKGVKVGLCLPNSPYSIMFFFGILKAGGTVVNYNPLYVERELSSQIEDSETDIMVTLGQKPLLDKITKMLDTTRLKKAIVCPEANAHPLADARYITFEAVVANEGKPAPAGVDIEETAVLQYTGGTTGIPKGAMLTHAGLYANMTQTMEWMKTLDLRAGDSIIGVLPLFHVFAMAIVMNCSLYAGVKILLFPKFELKDVLDAITKHRPTLFPAVPAVFNAIANAPEAEGVDFSCLRFCMTGGAPMPADVQRLFEQKTGTTAMAEGYGLTEASPVCTFNPPVGKRKRGSVGQPMPGTIVEILDREDRTTVLPVGAHGEVCITGPQVMKGYYRRPEATADVIRENRLHTGDVGYIDEEGYLHLVDRIKDLILVRGYNVYPRVVEEAIYLHPAVEECIVAGVPDQERGETVWAWVKPAAGQELTAETLRDFLIDKLSPIEVPRKIILRDKPLPKTAVGKLSRKDLLAQEGITRVQGGK